MLANSRTRAGAETEGIATDSARVGRATKWARLIAKPCRRLFAAPPMPDLVIPA